MIRFLEPQDQKSCVEMFAEFYQTDAVCQPIPLAHIENSVALALQKNPLLEILICEISGKYAGFCAISFTHSTEAGGMVALIEEIYLRQEFRGNGLGLRFFEFIKQTYSQKVKRFRLEVAPNNAAAIKFYHQLDFKDLPYKQMVIDL